MIFSSCVTSNNTSKHVPLYATWWPSNDNKRTGEQRTSIPSRKVKTEARTYCAWESAQRELENEQKRTQHEQTNTHTADKPRDAFSNFQFLKTQIHSKSFRVVCSKRNRHFVRSETSFLFRTRNELEESFHLVLHRKMQGETSQCLHTSLAERVLSTVSDVKEAIIFLVFFVQCWHQRACRW